MASIILKDAKTTWVDDNPFNIPNTDIYIWKIKLEVDGDTQLHSTMSKKVASLDFVGDVELYTNDNGKEYVRQAPKEQSSGGSSDSYGDGQAWGNALNVSVLALTNGVDKQDLVNYARYIFKSRQERDAMNEEKPVTEPEKAPQKRDWANVGKDNQKILETADELFPTEQT